MSTATSGAFVPRRFVSTAAVALAAALAMVMCGTIHAQILKTGGEGAPQKLFINILEGEGALNNIRQRDAREPVVQVTDENHKPVSGALVLFLIHNGSHGATATFNGAQTFTATTGPDGIAHAAGLQLGRNPGTFTISVTASVSVAAAAGVVASVITAEAVIHQSNIITALNSATSATSSTGTTATSGTTGGTAGTTGGTTSTAAHHGILHLSHAAKIVAVSAAAAATVVVVAVVVTSNSSTSLTLGSSTVGHP